MNYISDQKVGRPPGLRSNSPLETINSALEDLIPGSTTVDMRFDSSMIEYSDLRLNIDGTIRVPLDNVSTVLKNRNTVEPKIKTTMPPPRQTTFRQCLLALLKRNLGGSQVASPMNYKQFANEAFDNMMDVFAVSDWRERVALLDKVYPNEQSMIAWEAVQNPSTHSAMERIDPAYASESVTKDIDDYEFILKAMPKASTDTKPLSVYSTVQTVMFHKKNVNAFYGPMVREIDRRFRSILRDNVVYNKGKSIDEIEAHLENTYLPGKSTKIIENDFGDFDRSQQEVAHCLDEVLLERLGMRPEDLEVWMRGHNVHTNFNFSLGLKVTLLYQRKSGDVTTSFGNTVLNMTALAHGLRLKSCEVVSAMFLGDDSWLQLWLSSSLDERTKKCSERIAVHFNGEAKTASFDVGYFCGNYILQTTAGIKLAADPIKRAVKLGRWDVKTTDVLHENWISFRDLLRNYDDEEVQEKLSIAVIERMPKASYGLVKTLVEALNTYRASFKEFKGAYESEASTTVY